MIENDTKKAIMVRRQSIARCRQPAAMAIDTARRRLLSGCRSLDGGFRLSGRQGGRVGPDWQRVDGAKQEAGSREPEVGMKHARLRLRSERDANGLVTLCLARHQVLHFRSEKFPMIPNFYKNEGRRIVA